MSNKHNRHNRKHQHQVQPVIHEVERYNRTTMQDYCLSYHAYLTDIGNLVEAQNAFDWAVWIETAPAHEFNTTCDTWYTWELSQPQQLDLFAA